MLPLGWPNFETKKSAEFATSKSSSKIRSEEAKASEVTEATEETEVRGVKARTVARGIAAGATKVLGLLGATLKEMKISRNNNLHKSNLLERSFIKRGLKSPSIVILFNVAVDFFGSLIKLGDGGRSP